MRSILEEACRAMLRRRASVIVAKGKPYPGTVEEFDEKVQIEFERLKDEFIDEFRE